MSDLLTVVLPAAVILVVIFLILANRYLRADDDDYQGTTEPARTAHPRPYEPGRAAPGVRRTGPAYPDPDYQSVAGWLGRDSDRLDGGIPAQLAAAASRAQHLTEQRHYQQLEPDALEPCDLCGRVGLHTFSEWAREHSQWMAQQVTEAARFAGQNGLATAWAGNYELADAA